MIHVVSAVPVGWAVLFEPLKKQSHCFLVFLELTSTSGKGTMAKVSNQFPSSSNLT